VLKFAAAVCSPDLHTNGTLPYWTICTTVFDALTLVSGQCPAIGQLCRSSCHGRGQALVGDSTRFALGAVLSQIQESCRLPLRLRFSMAFGALDKTKLKKFLCWFSFVPMLLVEGFATSGKVAWEGWNAGAATEGPVERLVAPVGPKTNELLMTIFWLKIGAAAIKAVCAALLLYYAGKRVMT
jgi:hypothetical protein